MNLLGRINFASVGTLLLAGALFAGCSKNRSSPKVSPEAVKQSRLEWNLKTLVTDYENGGNNDSAWDEPAKRALTEFARTRAQVVPSGEPWAEVIATNCDAACKAGCTDPMVRYLYIRFAMSQTNTTQTFADMFCNVAQDMEKSSYSNIRKFYAVDRAVDQLVYAYGTNAWNMPVFRQLESKIGDYLIPVVQDKTTPPEEAFEVGETVLNSMKGDVAAYKQAYSMVEPPIFANWPEESTSWLLKGEAYIQMAWDARGNGFANTVTTSGWLGFSNNLAVAEAALNHAWKLNPHDARIPLKMLSVELGQGEGRDRMETWFERAMRINPNNYQACGAKLFYLEPKWYGSVDDMLEFGRECVQSTNWGGGVPLILVDAHYTICNEFTEESERTNYWKQPDVWNDVKSAYERFFQLNPNDTSVMPNYAWYAYHAEDWEKLNELIPKLGPANYAFFGGKDEFDKMVQLTQEHIRQPTNTP